MKTFRKYFEDYHKDSKIDQCIITDARMVYRALKTPKTIKAFLKADPVKKRKMVPELCPFHASENLIQVATCALMYADYYQKEKLIARKRADVKYLMGQIRTR